MDAPARVVNCLAEVAVAHKVVAGVGAGSSNQDEVGETLSAGIVIASRAVGG